MKFTVIFTVSYRAIIWFTYASVRATSSNPLFSPVILLAELAAVQSKRGQNCFLRPNYAAVVHNQTRPSHNFSWEAKFFL